MTKEMIDLIVVLAECHLAELADRYAIDTDTPELVRDHEKLSADYSRLAAAIGPFRPKKKAA